MSDKRGKLKKLLKLFLERALKLDEDKNLKTADIFEISGLEDKKYRDLSINIGFGQGTPTYVPYIAFLGYGQKTQKGIYPVILFYRKLKGVQNLIVSYGVSENEKPFQNWKLSEKLPTIGEFFSKYLSEEELKKLRYKNSYVFKAFQINSEEDITNQLLDDIAEAIDKVITAFHKQFREKPYLTTFGEKSMSTNERLFKDLMFDELQEKAFYNALKTKPFIILAGPSGTGKTKIVEALAKFMESNTLESNLILDEGTFEIDNLEVDFPLTIQGQGKDKTTLKVKNLNIKSPQVKFRFLTLTVENIEGLTPEGSYRLIMSNTPNKERFEVLEEELIQKLTIEKNKTVILENRTFIVKNDIKIEPDGELIIRNATIKFEKYAGIIGKDCTFIAENATFEALNEKWKNITLEGKIKGHIKGCTFKKGKGRKGKVINNLLGLTLWNEKTYGGALFVYSTEGKYLISNCEFENCRADFGGGVRTYNSTIKKCHFENCSAKIGGGVYAEKIVEIKECLFENCSAEEGGGVYCKEYSLNTLEGNIFCCCKPNNCGGVCSC